MSESIPQAAQHLFDEAFFAHVATIMRDGTPQTTPVWVARDGDTVLFNTTKNRAKYKNLRRDPRVSLSIHNHERGQPYEWIQVRGRGELADDTGNRHIDSLSRKYTGHDYANLRPGDQRVIVRVTPEHVLYSG